MRILYWLLGAAATAAAGAYVVNRGLQGRIAKDFLDALRRGPVSIHADEPSIIASGLRAESFRGEAAGRPFAFIAKVDVSGTRWTFALDWSGAGRFIQTWNTLSGESEHPLQSAYLLLRRHASKAGNSPPN